MDHALVREMAQIEATRAHLVGLSDEAGWTYGRFANEDGSTLTVAVRARSNQTGFDLGGLTWKLKMGHEYVEVVWSGGTARVRAHNGTVLATVHTTPNDQLNNTTKLLLGRLAAALATQMSANAA
jgi:hypothetical protein